MKSFILFVSLAITATFAQAQTIRYVKPSPSGSGDGSSWANASSNLQGMINASAANDQVWVAAGTYKPFGGRTSSFSLKNGVAVYGGFAGTETALEDRDWEANATILSGDIGVPNDASDNSIHVISNNGLDNSAVLDGFTIRDGNADGNYPNNYGGGMYNVSASPTIVNCKFTANSAEYGGAGMANLSGSDAVVTNCLFTANSSSVGGGMHNNGSSPVVSGCTFSSHNVSFGGGGMFNVSSTAIITNCVFSNNSGHLGGGMYNDGASPTVSGCAFSDNSGTTGAGAANFFGSLAVFTDCTFTGNHASSEGGGMYNAGASPDVTGCIFTLNTAINRGAGMSNNSASPTVTDCEFSNNTNTYAGGGISNGYGSSPSISNCTFTQNAATQWGGAIHNESDSSPTVSNCLISGNTADTGGGVASIFNSVPNLMNCTISGNSAEYGGGVSGDLAALTNCILIGNAGAQSGGGMRFTNGGAVLINCTISGNESPEGGAGVFAFNSVLTATNCIFWGNSSEILLQSSVSNVNYSIVQGGYAGTDNLDQNPIFVDQPPVGLGTGGDLRLQECSPAIDAGTNSGAPAEDIEGEPRPYNGATDMGAYERQTPVPPGANDTWYIDADGDGYGSTLVLQCDRPVNGFMLSELSGIGDCDDNDHAINPGATELCDGIDNNCNQQIDEDYVCCPAGVVYVKTDATGANDGTSWADAFTDLQDALSLANTCPTFSQIWVAVGVYKPTAGTDRLLSFSLKNGVAVYGGFDGTETELNQRDWTQNSSILSGDIGVPNNASDNSFHVVSNSGLNNTAILDGFIITAGNANGNFPHYFGGGMFNAGASPTVRNCIFEANAASGGGGMHNRSNSAPSLIGCTFSENTANSGGGMYNEFSYPGLDNCTFSANNAINEGGGMYNYTSSPTLDNCTFSQNQAYGGGGMANFFSSSPDLDNCTFSGNTASNNGGGIYNLQSPTLAISECEFTGNTAGYSGGGMYNQSASPVVTECSFNNNTATNYGGGIYNFVSSPQISGCDFTGNTAQYGAGMHNQEGSPVIQSCRFKGNLATIWGGGIQNVWTSPTIANCVFSGNEATFFGGGMYNVGVLAPVTVRNCSFSGNTAGNSGGGVLNDNTTTLTFSNCIFWGNNTETGTLNGGSPTFQYSIIKQASGVYPGTGNLNLDPLFIEQPPIGLGASGNLNLQACSPAIDMGTNDGAPAEDIEGNARPFNSFGAPEAQTDMGAWEYQQTQTPSAVPSITISGPEEVDCAGATYMATPVNGGASPKFNWKVNGISVGVFSASFTSNNFNTGDVVSCELTSTQPCAYPLTVSSNGITVNFTPNAPGDPSVFGDNAWNVYAWNAGGAEPSSDSWNTDYRGYYTVSSLNIATQAQWNSSLSPSAAPGYQGCAVGNDDHSWSAKRKGFTCGYYQIHITSHDDAAQLWIDGAMVWEHIGCCDSHNNVWEGFLHGDSEVEFRVTEGVGESRGGIFFQNIPAQLTGLVNLCSGGGSTTLALQNNPVGDYLWSTGATTPSITVSTGGTYSVTVSGDNGCSISTSGSMSGPAGDPAVFGDNVWNVYAWNAGGDPANGDAWNVNYAGFYVVGELDYNSFLKWPTWGAPSSAPGYQGCSVGFDNHSYSARRKGFPCGFYRLEAYRDDYSELWINGVKVWEAACCGYAANIWEGFLDTDSEVEFRISEDIGDSYGSLYFQSVSPTITGLLGLCGASTTTLSVSGASSGGDYLWSTNETTPTIEVNAPGEYSVTIDYGNGCSFSASGTVSAPAGDPTVFGDNIWHVYAWNAGGAEPNPDSWNTNYAGYYTVNSLNLSTSSQWSSTTSPSYAAGYQGCPVEVDNHSFSGKRRGFPSDYYQISINGHDNAAQLWINGAKVWEYIGCCIAHGIVWEGFLCETSEVEFRVTEDSGASFGNMVIQAVAPQISGLAGLCTGNSATLSLNVNPSNTPSYLWSTNETTPTIEVTSSGTYSVTLSDASGCSSMTASGTMAEPAGDPAVFGDNVWQVYAWNSGGALPTSDTWSANYAGYYTNSNLDFSTTSHWPLLSSPSAAAGYQGCPVNTNNHSWSAKRKGFPCGIFNIRVNLNDDAAQLWINGDMVWERLSSSLAAVDAWTGLLGPDDEVEFRTTENTGISRGSISFTDGMALSGTSVICHGATNGSVSAPEVPGVTYSWSNGASTATISNLAAGQYCVTPTGGCGALESQCFTIGSFPQLPPLSILPDGPTTVAPGTEVELCSSVEALTGNIYTLYTGGNMNKYTVDFNSNTLAEAGGYSSPYMIVGYGIDRNPVTGQVFVVGLNDFYYRTLFTLDLETSALVELGELYSTGGSNNVQSISFDYQGNLFAVFQGGVINQIDYNSPNLTPTNLPVSPGIPWNGYAGLTYDFDNNRLIYTTGNFSQVYGINPATGASNLILSSGVNAQAVEYVGNNMLYCSGPNVYGWSALDLTDGSYQAVTVPGSAYYPKDILYVPGSSFEWSGPEGSLGGEECITVAPQSTSTYTLVLTDHNGCSASATQTITVEQAGTTVSGYILWEHNQEQGVSQTSVAITGDHQETIVTGADGFYSFFSESGEDFSIKPAKNINKLNGLTAADASAIQQHLTNSNPLPAPYKRIAADVNKSNSITTLDATLINQALLGNPNALNMITSWRFVPASYTFPNPNVPWGFPEKIDLNGVSGNIPGQNFWGIKLGDVVATFANPANFGAGQPLVIRTADRELHAGQTFWVEVTADQLEDLAALQFALGFDPTMLRFESAEPLGGLPMTEDHFGAYNASQGEIRVVWSHEKGLDVEEAAPLFRLVFTALESGAKLSEVLFLGEDILPGKAFNGALLESGVQFVMEQFTGTADGTAGQAFQLLQNQPNPFSGSTTLRFALRESCEVRLRVMNVNGQELWRIQKFYQQGEHAELLRLGSGVPSGFLFCEMVTPSGKSVLKMAYSSN